MIENIATDAGRELGREIARLCDGEILGSPDRRCATCAFRQGEHVANGIVATLMSALKCVMEQEPFYCHEQDKACAGWAACVARSEPPILMPWEHVEDAGPNS